MLNARHAGDAGMELAVTGPVWSVECRAECSVIRYASGVCSVIRHAGDAGMELAVSGPVCSVECSCIVAECSVIRN